MVVSIVGKCGIKGCDQPSSEDRIISFKFGDVDVQRNICVGHHELLSDPQPAYSIAKED